jgi:putative PIN family toxin of toxin-antitoxin system
VRIVLDTNVLLAAFGTRGLCEALFSACLESQELVASEFILAELRRHLTRAFRMPARQAEDVIGFVREHSDMVLPALIPSTACRDPGDLPILGTAVAGRASLLVSGDRDLLGLKRYGDIPIVTPRDCYDRLAGQTEP